MAIDIRPLGEGTAMEIDVDELTDYCEFGPERVYLLVAIARAKDQDGGTSGSEPVIRKIVEDSEDLTQTIEELAHAVCRFDERYRLYLSANARNTTTAFFRLRERMDDWLEMRFHGNDEVIQKFKRLDREFVSVLQSDSCEPPRGQAPRLPVSTTRLAGTDED